MVPQNSPFGTCENVDSSLSGAINTFCQDVLDLLKSTPAALHNTCLHSGLRSAYSSAHIHVLATLSFHHNSLASLHKADTVSNKGPRLWLSTGLAQEFALPCWTTSALQSI